MFEIGPNRWVNLGDVVGVTIYNSTVPSSPRHETSYCVKLVLRYPLYEEDGTPWSMICSEPGEKRLAQSLLNQIIAKMNLLWDTRPTIR